MLKVTIYLRMAAVFDSASEIIVLWWVGMDHVMNVRKVIHFKKVDVVHLFAYLIIAHLWELMDGALDVSKIIY